MNKKNKEGEEGEGDQSKAHSPLVVAAAAAAVNHEDASLSSSCSSSLSNTFLNINEIIQSQTHVKAQDASESASTIMRKLPPTSFLHCNKYHCDDDDDDDYDVNSLTKKSLQSLNINEEEDEEQQTAVAQQQQQKQTQCQSTMDIHSSCLEEHRNKTTERKMEGSDAGYAGSASSNDCDEIDGSNEDSSSSSTSEYLHNGSKTIRDHASDLKKGNNPDRQFGGRGGGGARNLNLNVKKSNNHAPSPSSSDIADFSSSNESDSSCYGLEANDGQVIDHDASSSLNSIDDSNESDTITATKLSSPCNSARSQRRSGTSKRSRDQSNSPSTSLSKARKIAGFGSAPTGRINLPSSWDFIERSIRKKSTNNFHSKNTQMIEQTKALLNENYQLAIDGFNGNLSDICSLKPPPESQPDQDASTISYKSEHTPIYEIGVDVMANVLSYLSPPEIIKVLSEPLSKRFRESFTVPQDVWKIVCLSKPFYALSDEKETGKSDHALTSSSSTTAGDCLKTLYSQYKFRLMYYSFSRCVNYLDRIKYDLKQGKSKVSGESEEKPYVGNSSLRRFFARARGIQNPQRQDIEANGNNRSADERKNDDSDVNWQEVKRTSKSESKPKFAPSNITNRLLGPVYEAGVVGDIDLPISCAVYSIVNWMVAFADVAGIQVMCMNVLPLLLEDDHQRTTAQNAGMTDIVLRAMVIFPDNADLHTAAFHTLVLLARPIGGKEGMIFYHAMVNASGIFNVGSSTGKSGIAIMMDSMRRFASIEKLQAMSCWSMVNVALIQSQKVALVRLGGITAAGNAMMLHPNSEEVQFRAMFALINLVIPSENLPGDSLDNNAAINQEGEPKERSETAMLDDSIEFITDLVVVAMKNFCSNLAILNRACLVLHNLSLNAKYHVTMLFTPHCYQMLEWSVENYKQDRVLQQSARGSLQRLQVTLSNDESLRSRYLEMNRSKQRETS